MKARRNAARWIGAVTCGAFVAVLVPAEARGAKTFTDDNGLVVMQVESAARVDDWAAETSVSGWTGTCYYRWDGPDYMSTGGHGTLAYTINIVHAGDYNMRLRMEHDSTDGDQTHENDCWTRMDGGSWIKTYHNAGEGGKGWTWTTQHEIGSDHVYPKYNLTTGQHTFYISGRSFNLRIDRIHLYLDSVSDPLNTGYAETTGTAADPTVITFPTDGADLTEGQTYTLTGTGEGTLTWSYDANSDGLGRIDIGTGSPCNFTVPTDVTGAMEITIFLSAGGGEVNVLCNIISAGPPNDPPTANLTASPASGGEPLDVNLNANSSDPEGDPLTHEWDWSYSGGFSADHNTGATATASNTFSAGDHTVAVRVSDDHGNSTISTCSVTVTGNASPVADAGPDQTVQDDNLDDKHPVTLDASGSNDSDGSISSYEWTEAGAQVATGEIAAVNLDVGVHMITLTVTDNDGATGTDTVRITVEFQDDDTDGMADTWEIQYFSDLSETPDGDYDEDGYSNLGEFEAGTSPTDAGSHPSRSSSGLCTATVPHVAPGASVLMLGLLLLLCRPLPRQEK